MQKTTAVWIGTDSNLAVGDSVTNAAKESSKIKEINGGIAYLETALTLDEDRGLQLTKAGKK